MVYQSFRQTVPSKVIRRLRCAVLVIIGSFWCAISIVEADSFNGPQFRDGLWYFERTIEYVRKPPHENLLLIRTEATRCVDPNVAMRATFSLVDVGNCRSASPQMTGNQYIFANRCDFMGPVRTEITAESDTAYIEINLLTADPLPKRDMIVARRVGDCEIRGAQKIDSGSPTRR